jgi:hypothetical protein
VLWIASEKAKAAIPIDTSGKLGASFSAEEIRTLSLTPKGELVVAARTAVRFGPKDIKSFAVPTDKGVPESLEKITAAAVTQNGSILVADEKRNRVCRYDAQFQYQGPFPDAKPHSIVRLLVDGEGGIVMLDDDEKTVRVYDEAGKLLRTVGGKGANPELKHPTDVAVDAARNLYISDEEAGVLVVSPNGKLLTTVSGEALKRAKALTLDPSGAILAYDDKAQRVVRFQ